MQARAQLGMHGTMQMQGPGPCMAPPISAPTSSWMAFFLQRAHAVPRQLEHPRLMFRLPSGAAAGAAAQGAAGFRCRRVASVGLSAELRAAAPAAASDKQAGYNALLLLLLLPHAHAAMHVRSRRAYPGSSTPAPAAPAVLQAVHSAVLLQLPPWQPCRRREQ